MKKIMLLVLLLTLLSFNTYAIQGYVALQYNTLDETGVGEINIYQDLNEKWRIGGRLRTDLMGFNMKGGYFPAGVPESQTYDLYIHYKLTEDITLTFTEGCKHYFSQSYIPAWEDENYINVGVKYEFGDD